MRKIKHILANMDKLKGEYDALMRCSAKSTRSEWRDIVEVMDEVRLTEPKHIQPTQFSQIHRLTSKGRENIARKTQLLVQPLHVWLR